MHISAIPPPLPPPSEETIQDGQYRETQRQILYGTARKRHHVAPESSFFSEPYADEKPESWSSTTRSVYTPKRVSRLQKMVGHDNDVHFAIAYSDQAPAGNGSASDLEHSNGSNVSNASKGSSILSMSVTKSDFVRPSQPAARPVRRRSDSRYPPIQCETAQIDPKDYTETSYTKDFRSTGPIHVHKLDQEAIRKCHVDLGQDNVPTKYGSVTKECYVPQTLGEETGRRDKRDERKSTVLDNPDGEKGDWVTMMTKDFSKIEEVKDRRDLIFDNREVKKYLKSVHFSLGTTNDPVDSEYHGRFVPFQTDAAARIAAIKDRRKTQNESVEYLLKEDQAGGLCGDTTHKKDFVPMGVNWDAKRRAKETQALQKQTFASTAEGVDNPQDRTRSVTKEVFSADSDKAEALQRSFKRARDDCRRNKTGNNSAVYFGNDSRDDLTETKSSFKTPPPQPFPYLSSSLEAKKKGPNTVSHFVLGPEKDFIDHTMYREMYESKPIEGARPRSCRPVQDFRTTLHNTVGSALPPTPSSTSVTKSTYTSFPEKPYLERSCNKAGKGTESHMEGILSGSVYTENLDKERIWSVTQRTFVLPEIMVDRTTYHK